MFTRKDTNISHILHGNYGISLTDKILTITL